MKYIFQLLRILLITVFAEILAWVIPFPIPACIYGMVLMLVGLSTKIIPLNSVSETGKFLIQIMPVMFIPATVGLLDCMDSFVSLLLPCALTIVVVTLAVMAVSGRVTQRLLKKKK